MWLRLAALFGCTVKEAQARCDFQEFQSWKAFYEIEPWGWRNGWMQAGQICSAIHATKGNPVEPESFFYPPEPEEEVPQPSLKLDAVREAFRSMFSNKGSDHG